MSALAHEGIVRVSSLRMGIALLLVLVTVFPHKKFFDFQPFLSSLRLEEDQTSPSLRSV